MCLSLAVLVMAILSQPLRLCGVSWVVAFLSWAGCTTLLAQSPSTGDGTRKVSQAASPPPAPVPPNASRIIATVLKYSVWPTGSLQNTTPSVPSDQTLYSLTVEIHTSDPENPELGSHAVPGQVIEAFSSEPLAADLVGKKIEATLKLTGDTRGVRWFISAVDVFP